MARSIAPQLITVIIVGILALGITITYIPKSAVKHRDWSKIFDNLGGVSTSVPNTELTKIRFEEEKLTCYVLENDGRSFTCIRE